MTDYRRRIAEYIRAEAQPPDKFAHQPRLYRLARRLGESASFDEDVLFAAAWLHDLGVFTGHRPTDPSALAAWDHIAYTLKVLPDLLRTFEFPAGKIPAVLEAIRTHMPSGQPASLEGVLLRDADILEQLGAVGILRWTSKVGRDTRYVDHEAAVNTLRRHADELPGQLKLPLARRLAEERLSILRAFFDAVAAEEAFHGLELDAFAGKKM